MKWLKDDRQVETNDTELLLQRIDTQIDTQIEIQHKSRNNLLDIRLGDEVIEEVYKIKKE